MMKSLFPASEALTDGQVHIFKLTGELILSESFNGTSLTIREKLLSGIYLIEVASREGILIKKNLHRMKKGG
jgi:hypothetical protein